MDGPHRLRRPARRRQEHPGRRGSGPRCRRRCSPSTRSIGRCTATTSPSPGRATPRTAWWRPWPGSSWRSGTSVVIDAVNPVKAARRHLGRPGRAGPGAAAGHRGGLRRRVPSTAGGSSPGTPSASTSGPPTGPRSSSARPSIEPYVGRRLMVDTTRPGDPLDQISPTSAERSDRCSTPAATPLLSTTAAATPCVRRCGGRRRRARQRPGTPGRASGTRPGCRWPPPGRRRAPGSPRRPAPRAAAGPAR